MFDALQKKLVELAAVLLAVLLACYVSYTHGYAKSQTEWFAKENAIRAEAAEKLNAAVQANVTKERELAALISVKDTQLYESTQNHEKVIKDYESKLRSGAERLSIAINRATSTCASSTDTGTASQSGKEERADVMPETAARILGIAGDAAKDVRDYNALVDIYNAARTACNSSK